ncbi:unnamed protein product [Cladocopium goreaui]|uniref:N-acetylmuramoyl-L-alanine amidase domain-containing protein n=1 Tax=Cladocopium goreaui TaxID=2562237 RepID=A0A9P1C517_9DINO|nr:unnamed protein product [Cladocopium goreaui]
MPWPHVAWWFKASAVFTELRTWLVLTWRPKHREVFKIFRDLLKRALGARDLRILHLSLLELKKSLEEQNPNLQEPVQEGHFNHEAALEFHLSRLTNILEGEGGYDRHRVELLFESCCCTLGLVEEALDQATSRASNTESTSYGSGHPSTGYSLQDTVGHSGHASKIIPFLREYSHFEPSMGPETLGEDIQPRDVRAPVRKRINRCTGEFLKPELILIGCTNGKSREEAVLNFNHSGLGPNYIIAKDGKSESFVDKALCAWWGNPACWRLVRPVYTFEGVGEHSEVHAYAISIGLEGDGEGNESFTEAQYTELLRLIVDVKQRHRIKAWNILGLAEVSMPPGRFSSPGTAFDWRKISDVTFNVDAGEKSAVGDVRGLMQEWGYGLGLQELDFQNRLQIFRCRYGLQQDADHYEKDVAHLKALIDARSAEMQT